MPALTGERLHDRVRVDGERVELLVLAREDAQHVAELAQRRVGPPDHGVEVAAAAGHARPELAEDDRQPLAVGLAHDVVDQVEVDRRLRAVDGQQVLALARAVVDPPQRARGLHAGPAALCRLALHEALADQRLRPHGAARVGPEVLIARVVDPQDDRGLEVRRDLDGVDRADLDAGDLHVLARDDEARVVEDGAHFVAVVAVGAQHDHDGQRGEDDQEGSGSGERRAHHGPGGARSGSQSSVPLESRHGAEPSAAGCDAPPGQRRRLPVSRPSKRCAGGLGTRRPPAGSSMKRNALKIGWTRA